LRIAFASYAGFDGAGVKHAHEFANRLCGRGHDVLMLLPGEEETAEILAQPPSYPLQRVWFREGALGEGPRRALRAFDPDLLHLWTPRHVPSRIALEALSTTRARLIVHCEDDEEWILEHVGGGRHFSRDDRRLYRLLSGERARPSELIAAADELDLGRIRDSLLDPFTWHWIHPLVTPLVERLTDAFTSISPAYQRVLRRRWNKTVRILYPGVDPDLFQPRRKPPDLVRRFDLEGATTLLYSGPVAPFHDFSCLIDALPEVLRDFPDLVVVQLGTVFVPELVERVENDDRLSRHVRLAGSIDHSEMPRYLALADAFVGPLRPDRFNRHRLPSKVPEYLAMGRPLLCMAGGVGHELEDGVQGVKVSGESRSEVADGLRRLLRQRNRWPAMGERARHTALRLFDWERSTDRLEVLYREALSSPGAGKGPASAAATQDVLPGREDLFSPGALHAGATRMVLPEELPHAPPILSSRRDPRPRVLLLTEGRVGSAMSGIGIRYLEMARALARSFPVELGHAQGDRVGETTIPTFSWAAERAEEVLARADQADVLLVHGFVLDKLPALARCRGRLVVDAYCPFVFENLEIHRDRGLSSGERTDIHWADLAVLLNQLRCADYLLCCHPRQRDWLAGLLTAIGAVNPASRDRAAVVSEMVGLVPFGLPDDPPKPLLHPRMKGVWPGIDPGDLVLLWGGGIWSWLDPETVVRAMELVARRRSDVKLVFLSTETAEAVIRMPVLDRVRGLAHQLGLAGDTVFFNENYVDYEARVHFFLEADLGVWAQPSSFESHFAFRSRALDCLHVGLPMLVSEGDHFADLVAEHGLGRTVPPGDPAAWARAILELAGSPAERERCRRRILERRRDFTWSRSVEPLARFCRTGARRRGADGRVSTAPFFRLPADRERGGAFRTDRLSTVRERLRKVSDGVEALLEERRNQERSLAELQDRHRELRHHLDAVVAHAERLEAKVDIFRRIPLLRLAWRLLFPHGGPKPSHGSSRFSVPTPRWLAEGRDGSRP
jgi:glycosyltransferase involved in cell wall biosynthesis